MKVRERREGRKESGKKRKRRGEGGWLLGLKPMRKCWRNQISDLRCTHCARRKSGQQYTGKTIYQCSWYNAMQQRKKIHNNYNYCTLHTVMSQRGKVNALITFKPKTLAGEFKCTANL